MITSKFKQCLSGLLAALMVLTLLPSAAWADTVASGICGDHLTWVLDSEGTLTISGTGKMEAYWRDAPWYDYKDSVQTAVIQQGVTSIGSYAFYDCSSLSSISIPDSVTRIGYSAFYDCSSLTSVTIPGSVTYIDGYAFAGCTSLTSITIPSSVTSIGNSAFRDCTSLSSIKLPNNLTEINYCTFSGCTSLTSISIPNGVTGIDNRAFSGCSSLTSVSIPDSVTSIGSSAFSGCSSLTSVSIPDSVTSIGYDAFEGCASLTAIQVASGNPNYSSSSGVLCNKAKTELILCPEGFTGSYTIPSSVTSIYSAAFSSCTSLTAIQVASGNPNYSSSSGVLFNKAKTELLCYPAGRSGSYTIPNSVTTIKGSAFSDCTSLTGVSIPNSVTSIGYGAFEGCTSLSSITIPNSVTSIGWDAFAHCTSLTYINLPKGINTISGCMLMDCPLLEELTVPEGVTTIEKYAFGVVEYAYGRLYADAGCDSLKEMTLPKSLTTISEEAFFGCPNLTDIYYTGSETQWNEISIGEWGNDYLLNATIHYNYVPEPVTPAAPVVSISTVTSTGRIKLTWSAVDGAAKYYIYRSTDGGKTYSYYTSTTSTSWTNKSVTPGTKYYYKIKAICSNTEGNSAYSNVVYRTADCAKPSLSSSIVSSSGAIKLTWGSVTGASKYYIYRSTDGGKTYSYYTSTTSTSWTNKSVTPGTKYYYKIKAICSNTEGNSAYSNAVYRTADCAKPSLSSSIVSSSGAIKLSWSKVTGATKYYIYRSTDGGTTYKYYTSTTSTSWTNKSVTPGTKYYYKIKAICSNTEGNSAYSNVVYRTADCAKPSLSSSIVTSSGAIKLTWGSVTGASKYYIYRSTDGGTTYKYYTSTTSTSWTNKSVTPGTKYYYKIKAICSNTEGNSAYSNVVYRTADCAKPVVTIQLNSGKPQLKWSAVTGATKYYIYRSTDGTSFSFFDSTTKLSYTNTGAKSGTTYYYKVKAICSNTEGNSAYSSVVSIKSK